MSKYTPGPWRNTPSGVIEGDAPVVVARVYYGSKKGQMLEEYRANARLIAAAPEMLRALRNVVITMGQNHDFVMLENMVKLAAEAIAKAQGKL